MNKIDDDTWAAFGAPTEAREQPTHIPPTLEPSAADWLDLTRQRREIDAALQLIEGEIAHSFPDIEGEVKKFTQNYEVTVTRAERWSWDQGALREIYGEEPLPDFIRRSLNVDKRRFRALPESEQVALRHALTRTLTGPKVKVIKCSKL